MNTIQRTGIILLLLILLPSAIFAWFELSSLSSSEQIIERIYNNQLDAILYSVNQYSEDIITSWISRIESTTPTVLINNTRSIDFIFIQDSSGALKFYPKNEADLVKIKPAVSELMDKSKTKVARLFSYGKEGYKKAEPITFQSLKGTTVVLSVMASPNQNKICGIGINSNLFIKEVLGPKVLNVSQNEFVISVFRKDTKENIYSTNTVNVLNIQNERKLWLLPDYSIGIFLQGGTIKDYVRSRAETNLILIIILVIILLIGFWFVFRSIRKEVQLAQIKSEFVSNVSHELRTPLALISMFAETLEMGRARTEEKKKEYYTIISQEAGRLSKIVNRILNFSQMEAGKRKFSFAKIDINEVVENVFNTYKFHLHNKGFNFSFIPENDLPGIFGDKDAIAEAVINIIDNAVKYSRDNKEVEISTGRIGEFVFIKVKDAGIGISEHDQKRIFDKFFRVSTGDVHNTKGTGLGLTLVKHIVEAHHGEITLHSTLGKGSSFILKFKPNTD